MAGTEILGRTTDEVHLPVSAQSKVSRARNDVSYITVYDIFSFMDEGICAHGIFMCI